MRRNKPQYQGRQPKRQLSARRCHRVNMGMLLPELGEEHDHSRGFLPSPIHVQIAGNADSN